MKARVKDSGKWIEVVLEGAIAETTELMAAAFPSERRIRLDVGGVTSINSMGVRTWTNFLKTLCDQSEQVVIQRLPPTMVSQASMVKNFLQSSLVESFFAPYCCEECGHEDLELFHTHDEIPETLDCPECDEEMQFDDLPDTYLAFRGDPEKSTTIIDETPTPVPTSDRIGIDETTDRF